MLKINNGGLRLMRLRSRLLTFIFIIGLAACSDFQAEQKEAKGYLNVSLDQFVEISENKDTTLINTHIPYEGEIPGTDLLIPFNEIERHQADLPDDKTSPIVVYCKAGPMGDAAARKLVQMGYTHVIHFKAGMNGWEKAGKSLQFRSR